MELARIAAGAGVHTVWRVFITLCIAHFVSLRIQHGVQGLLNGASYHLIQVPSDLAFVNPDNLAQ